MGKNATQMKIENNINDGEEKITKENWESWENERQGEGKKERIK